LYGVTGEIIIPWDRALNGLFDKVGGKGGGGCFVISRKRIRRKGKKKGGELLDSFREKRGKNWKMEGKTSKRMGNMEKYKGGQFLARRK